MHLFKCRVRDLICASKASRKDLLPGTANPVCHFQRASAPGGANPGGWDAPGYPRRAGLSLHGARDASWVRTRGNGFKLKESGLSLDIGKAFLAGRVGRAWH